MLLFARIQAEKLEDCSKAGFLNSFNNNNCSRTVSQVTQGCHLHANTSDSKVGFKLATDCIQFRFKKN